MKIINSCDLLKDISYKIVYSNDVPAVVVGPTVVVGPVVVGPAVVVGPDVVVGPVVVGPEEPNSM